MYILHVLVTSMRFWCQLLFSPGLYSVVLGFFCYNGNCDEWWTWF